MKPLGSLVANNQILEGLQLKMLLTSLQQLHQFIPTPWVYLTHGAGTERRVLSTLLQTVHALRFWLHADNITLQEAGTLCSAHNHEWTASRLTPCRWWSRGTRRCSNLQQPACTAGERRCRSSTRLWSCEEGSCASHPPPAETPGTAGKQEVTAVRFQTTIKAKINK